MEMVFTATAESQSKDLVGYTPGSPDGPTVLAQQPCEAAVSMSTDPGPGGTSYFLT